MNTNYDTPHDDKVGLPKVSRSFVASLSLFQQIVRPTSRFGDKWNTLRQHKVRPRKPHSLSMVRNRRVKCKYDNGNESVAYTSG